MSHTSDSQGTSSCTNLSAEIDYLQLVPIHSQIKYYRVAHLDGAPHAIYGIHMQFWNPCTDPDLRLQPFLPSKDSTTLRIKNTHQQTSGNSVSSLIGKFFSVFHQCKLTACLHVRAAKLNLVRIFQLNLPLEYSKVEHNRTRARQKSRF